MDIEFFVEKKGYSAHIAKLGISTEGETLDELMKNINEAIELYYDEDKKHTPSSIFSRSKFYFDMSSFKHAFDYQACA